MVDQTNIFEGSTEQGTDQSSSTNESVFQVPSSAQDYVGEGKKYDSVEKALESIPNAQSHIQKLESEMAELRAKLETQSTIEDTLKKFTEDQKDTGQPASQPIDLNAIDKLLEDKLMARTQQQVASKNVEEVIDTLTSQFGDVKAAEQEFVKKADELGVDVSVLNDLAAKSPKAVYNLFNGSVKQPSQSMSTPSVNSEAFISANNVNKPTEIPKIMHGASTQDMVAAFKAAAATVNS